MKDKSRINRKKKSGARPAPLRRRKGPRWAIKIENAFPFRMRFDLGR